MSATINAADVKALRERTGAGMMDCKQALTEAGGDAEQAVEILRAKGQASAAKRAGREAGEGVVASYVHANDRIGVLVEVDCETDFVARNDDFREFAREVAIHVAATNPRYIDAEDVPEDVREHELSIFAQQAAPDKPADIRDQIAQGKLEKWLQEVVLLDQEHVNADKHEGRTIEQMRADLAAKTGENVVIRRFVRYEVGGD